MRSLIVLILVSLGVLTVAAGSDDSETLPGPNTAAGRTLTELVKLHNRERAEAKLPPLSANAKLYRAALGHARDMAEHLTMSHDGSDGSQPAQRLERVHYRYQAEAENVAFGQNNAREVMHTWMNSPPHKKNILGAYQEMGGAAVLGKNRQLYWCVDFGTPWPSMTPEHAAVELLAAINHAREDAHLPPMKDAPKLRAASLRIARHMAARERLEPKDDDGRNPFELATKEGYRFQRMSGEVTAGQLTPQDVIKIWLERPGHRDNFLGDYAELGIGYATAPSGKPYWSVIFAQPLK